MPEYDNTNRGQIWKNDRKEADTQPDFKGDINIEGVEYWISAWKRSPDASPKAPALKITVTKKEAKPEQSPPAHDTTGADVGFDDDIPF